MGSVWGSLFSARYLPDDIRRCITNEDIESFTLNPFRQNRLSHTILKKSNFNFRYNRLCHLDMPCEKMAKLPANSGDPDQAIGRVEFQF